MARILGVSITNQDAVMHAYFPVLNAVRLYAALSVFLVHVEGYAFGYPMETRTGLHRLALTGHDAVSLFFVLSGFLITYLLLNERQQTGDISPRRFYWRRSLRIFPLYFVVMALTALLVPGRMPQPEAMPFYVLMIAYVAIPFFQTGILWHYWSVSVEETFYMAWSPIVRHFSVPRVVLLIILVRVLLMAIFFSTRLASFDGIYSSSDTPELVLFRFARFECMAIGALGAWLLFQRHWALRLLYCLDLPAAALVVLIAVFLEGHGGIFYDITLALIFMTFLVNVCSNPRSCLRWLERPLTRRLGAVTYGLYLLHPLCIVLSAHVLAQFVTTPSAAGDVLLYAASGALSLVAAFASYRFVEAPFLRLKDAAFHKASHVAPVR